MGDPSKSENGAPLDELRDWIGTILRYRSSHPASVRVLDVLERLLDRPRRMHGLLHGEPGTGKEGLARALHMAMHPDSNAPFVKIPTGGRDPEVLARHLFGTEHHRGAIDRAQGGTLFLDEVALLPRETQARLAPVLRGHFRREDDERPRPCDVGVVGATDHDIEACVAEGRFRHDLYYRLARIELTIPPLRERVDDIPRAAVWTGNRLLRLHGERSRLALAEQADEHDLVLDPGATEVLKQQPWRGNFRELDRVMERAIMLYRDGSRVGPEAVRRAME
jgi:DNA-binding NtrC family response regulator